MKIFNELQSNAKKALMARQTEPVGMQSRRQFFSTLAVGALAVSPTLKIIDSITSEPFQVFTTKLGFQVIRDGQVVWEASKSTLGMNASIKMRKRATGWNFSVKRALYAETAVELSLAGEIKKKSGNWLITMVIPELEITASTNFIKFIDGESSLQSPVTLGGILLNFNEESFIASKGNLTMELNSSWKMRLGGKDQLFLSSCGEVFNLSAISLLPFWQATSSSRFKLPKINKGTAVYLEGFEDWKSFLDRFKFLDNKAFSVAETPNSILALVGRNRRGAAIRLLTAEALEKKLYLRGRVHQPYHFENYFFSSVFSQPRKTKFNLTASLSNKGQWISNAVGSFCLKRNKNLPDLELNGIGFEVKEEHFEPMVKAFQPEVKDGFALATVFSVMPEMRIEDGQPPTRTPRVARPTSTETQQEQPQRVEPQRPAQQPTQTPTRVIDAAPQVATPVLEVQFDKARFRPLGPMSIKIVRPEDLVSLQFVFHNFKFTSRGQGTLVELENARERGVIEILFPSQHTLEEAYFEQTSLDSGSGGQEVRLPARHIRAQRSKLVYQIQPGQAGFELSLKALLDWSKFSLVVHPRANIRLAEVQPFEINLGSLPRPTQDISRTSGIQPAHADLSVKLAESPRQRINRANLVSETSVSNLLTTESASSLRVSQQAVARAVGDGRPGPIPSLFTSIEAPALLFVSPNQVNDFSHSVEPAFRQAPQSEVRPGTINVRVPGTFGSTPGEIVELWHTSMGVKLSNKKIFIRGLGELKTIRALWAFDAKTDFRDPVNMDQPFQASLDANNRHKLVHTTSNYSIQGFVPQPVPVKKLMLTPLGAYIDWHGFFKVPAPTSNHLNIIEWEHLATLGRDHFVKIVEEGYLFPLGHRAALVTITERKFDRSTKAAVNRKRMFVVVLQKEVLYQRNDPNGNFIKYPFVSATIQNESTPDIDKPNMINLGRSRRIGTPQGSVGPSTKQFFIEVGGRGFPFKVTVIDKEGQEHHINIFLAFVENSVARTDNLARALAEHYNSATGLNVVEFAGRGVAYAESLIEGDTEFETTSITLGAQHYPARGTSDLKFHPFMQLAEVFIRQVYELTGIMKPAKIVLEDDNNQGMVFAKVSDAVVDFTGCSDKAGGFVLPNMSISGLSKLQGPIGGDIEDLMKLSFVPDKFFKGIENLPIGKIFGVIELFTLLQDKPNIAGAMNSFVNQVKAIRERIEKIKNELLALQVQSKEGGQTIESLINQHKALLKDEADKLLKAISDQAPKIPNFKAWLTTEAFFAEYKWIPELKNSPISVAGILDVHVAKPKEALEIKTTLEKPFKAATSAKLTGVAKFTDFDIEIRNALKVNFKYIEFKTGTGKKSDIKVGLKPVPINFMGPLSFVNNLQSLIPSGGFGDDGPYVNITPQGVKAGFNMSVPDVEVGAMMISNINLGAYINLPFNGDELTIGFNFCKRENPFMLTISCFGGGGYFMMVTSLRGLKSVEAAFEFGAAVSLNLGVASGSVLLMGGFYFKSEIVSDDNRVINLTGFVRINGNLSVLGIINISMEFYLALAAVYVTKTIQGKQVQKVEKMEGVATLKVKVEVLFFSKTVSVTVRRQFAGADADPTFAEMITLNDWKEYCLAFAN